MSNFTARERASLSQELLDELYQVIHEHGAMATLTVAEVVGVLELLKFRVIDEQEDADFQEDEE